MISERAGVNNWLRTKGVKSNNRQQEILARFKRETGISFWKSWWPGKQSDKDKIESSKRFQTFIKWCVENEIIVAR